MSLRFGLTATHPTWPALLAACQEAERLGFDTFWVVDHVVPPRDPTRPSFEAWTALGALAAHTRRIRLGALTTNVLFRNPVLLAKQAMTLDHISAGRLELALGSGNPTLCYPMAGIDPGPVRERVARLREVVEIVDRLLRSEVVTYRGHYYWVEAGALHPGPVQRPRPPLTIGAHQPAALAVAAAYADRWNTFGGFGLSTQECLRRTRERIARLEAACTAHGRDPATLARSFLAGFTEDAPWASPAAFEDFVGRYRALGFTEFLFRWPQAHESAVMRQVAERVLPALRG